ncbi:MAG TPA: hypothetical protein VJS44_18460 [Pyrinomonadaceae bacterium]|nr:hypothetical protein [Pyrinomonadaceae bacterium]
MSIAKYSFLPWLRRGLANLLEQSATGVRAELSVSVVINKDLSHPIIRKVNLIGPADVIGINPAMIVRTEPRNWITDFEPNYLAFVEFYDEDFPWRYSPETIQAHHRLTPWLCLMLLKEDEFSRDDSPNKPLPAINVKVTRDEVLPDPDEIWAWAHVHLNAEVTVDGNHSPNLSGLNALLGSNPDRAVSRVLCPRRLQPDTGYYAFLIPAYEVGRKAGVGEKVNETDAATALSWVKGETGDKKFPVYYEWFFRTGVAGDFEALVRQLQPKTLDERVGMRYMDVQQPGFGMPVIHTSFKLKPEDPEDVVGLEGALKAPATKAIPLSADSNFPSELEPIVNLPAEAQANGVDDDPVISPPLYGRWHALVERLSIREEDANWVNELNKDPRYRALAGFGTRVVQKNQEEYMRKAWEQVGEVLAANRKIIQAQWAMQTSNLIFLKHLSALPPAKVLQVTAAVHRKILGSPVTVHHHVRESRLPPAALSGAFRKLLRPHGLLAQRFLTDPARNIPQIINQLNDGTITAAPPKGTSADAPTLENVAEATAPKIPGWLAWLLKYNLWLLVIILALLLALFLIVGGIVTLAFSLLVAAAAVAGYIWTQNLKARLKASESVKPEALTQEALEAVPQQSNFELMPGGQLLTAAAGGASDNAVAASYRAALTDYAQLMEVRAPEKPVTQPLNIRAIHATVMEEIRPHAAFPKRVLPTIKVGANRLEEIEMVMAYPDIKDAMYKPLAEISEEFFVPNLNLIEQNTIALMVTNERFIEAYMAGLNHEFARELLWREYPTDQRGSPFRQFWEVTSFAKDPNLTEAARVEKLKDITPLHTWTKDSKLGEHSNREELQRPVTPDDPDLVIVIRGDLLKRYPNTLIYAQAAKWGTTPETANQLIAYDETGQLIQDGDHIKYPLYKAHVAPDIYFLGFDLKVKQAKGEVTEETAAERARLGDNNLGWFFIIKEIPGEPRFGLDEGEATDPTGQNIMLESWDDLSWRNLGGETTKIINLASRSVTVTSPAKNPENVQWNSNAADMAYVLYQQPVLVAIHAREMLKGI